MQDLLEMEAVLGCALFCKKRARYSGYFHEIGAKSRKIYETISSLISAMIVRFRRWGVITDQLTRSFDILARSIG